MTGVAMLLSEHMWNSLNPPLLFLFLFHNGRSEVSEEHYMEEK